MPDFFKDYSNIGNAIIILLLGIIAFFLKDSVTAVRNNTLAIYDHTALIKVVNTEVTHLKQADAECSSDNDRQWAIIKEHDKRLDKGGL